jgi:hypothetical protein
MMGAKATRIAQASVIVLSMALAACGGGGGSGGVVSTPAPTPSASPTSFTYTKIPDLVGSQTFDTVSASTVAKPDGMPSPETIRGLSGSVTISYDFSVDTYTLQGYGVADSFTLTDVRVSGDPKAVYLEKTGANGLITAATRLITPSPDGIDLSYVRYGYWYTTKDTLGPGSSLFAQPRTSWLVGGIPTQPADVPKSGGATFASSSVIGAAAETSTGQFFDLRKSSATFAADFASNSVTTMLNLIGTPTLGGADRSLGSFSGTGTIGLFSQPRNVFQGTFAVSNANAEFKGAFFGPAAAEYGYGYSLLLADLVAVGAVAGAR